MLLLLAEGLTNRQIAGRLYLAEKTIKNYVTTCCRRWDGPPHRGRGLRRPASQARRGRTAGSFVPAATRKVSDASDH